MSEKARVSIIINGQVQGVFFRYKTQQEAQKLGLTGWVRNNADSSVEILAEGDKDKLEELIAWCKAGPRSAQVENVEVNWAPYRGEFEGFEIR
ncbi:MAG: acylphosphatase [Candidatus Buchananbacteria bacterium RBG_13_36_9]|uniref:acylphosphatase n=1 Tax=Candidatus Buchananbacteria bacterium RBG_13_36_9 TaxID=1797530 RepID=A0A1G1XNU9_9BACT|nr:MAG: acylphosphatase [Candidatus Buchananbacteria bacterium RBG_13_36_9]